MQRTTTLVVSVLALSALLGGTAVATGNQPPLADAGLDQSAERATTVQLDANGSRDPDGTIKNIEWSIETPDGTTHTPDCPTCVQTTFSPADTGQYNVTVTVTDDDGVSRSDTLHVDVVAAGGPSVSVSAPAAVPIGLRRNLTANVTAGDADLRTLAWAVNGTAQNQTRLTGENATSTITHTFNDSGSVSVRAIAYDAAGRRGVANRTIQVARSSGNGGSGGVDSCPGGSGSYYVDGENKGCTSAAMTIGDTIVDTDGRDGLWLYMDSELTKIISEDNMNKYSEDGYGGTFSKETIDEQKNKIKERDAAAEEPEKPNNDGSSDGIHDDGGSTRPNSSVPNNLMNPSGEEDSNGNDGGYDWSYDNDDDGSSSSDSGRTGNSEDSSSAGDSNGNADEDDGGILGGLLGGEAGGNDNDDDDDDDGGWFGVGGNEDNGDDSDGGWGLW
ncbi:PKD domain-containing protein [Haloarcula sp. NS06]|uniref:PKD domain-containing protein n=1 Tax=Haloarcula sp. NS06 TaxID=3409688 RepID=UPI003DA6D194